MPEPTPHLFRTPLRDKIAYPTVHHRDGIFAIGSCFTEHITERLRAARFDVSTSPFGTVYNPLSVKEQLLRLAANQKFAEGELIKTNELWHTWLHHGSYSGTDQAQTLAQINHAFLGAYGKLQSARCVIVTVGAAIGYKLRDGHASGRVAANCHKAPAAMFEKVRFSVDECTDALIEAVSAVRSINPDAQIWLTVSPVKHLRDGMIENLRSKSALLLACEEVTKTVERVSYLPVYELVTEDLRDYRWYAADMCHPNAQAIDYVWQWFTANCMDAPTQAYAHEAERLHRAAEHRPLHPETDAWRKFVEQKERDEAAFRRWHTDDTDGTRIF